jgi:hypothetical protein
LATRRRHDGHFVLHFAHVDGQTQTRSAAGYHNRTTVHDLETLRIRTYISEPERGQRLLRRRSELLERPCAHLYETGALRRAHVRGHENVLKRLLVHASGFIFAS